MRSFVHAIVLSLAVAGLPGCGDDDDDDTRPGGEGEGEGEGEDGGLPDGGEPDGGEPDGGEPDGGGPVDVVEELEAALDAQIRANETLTDPDIGGDPSQMEAALAVAAPDLQIVGSSLANAQGALDPEAENTPFWVAAAQGEHAAALAVAALVPDDDEETVPIRFEEIVTHGAATLAAINLALLTLGEGPSARGEGHVLAVEELDVPPGYEVEIALSGLSFATAIAVDDAGAVYVAEAGYSYGNVTTSPRVIRLETTGELTPIVTEDLVGPVNGLAVYQGYLLVSHRGFISRFDLATNERVDLVTNLPSYGDHHNNDVFVDEEGDVHFTQGTVTNTGVVGLDNYIFGWLPQAPQLHDIPCRDVELAGLAFTTGDPLTPDPSDLVQTGAFVPFGMPTTLGDVIPAAVPCSGAVLRMTIDGENLEAIADGLRNPFALAMSGDGRLFVSENGPDLRGSRPIEAGDNLWEVLEDGWYGWPDYYSGQPDGTPVLRNHPPLATTPFAVFEPHAAVTGFSFATNEEFAPLGTAFVASFGSMAPVTTAGDDTYEYTGHVVYSVTPSGSITDFLTSDTYEDGEPFLRATDARFSADGRTLWVTHFGEVRAVPGGVLPSPETGALIRIRPAGLPE